MARTTRWALIGAVCGAVVMANPSEFLGTSGSSQPGGLEGGAAASMAATKTTQDPSDLLYKGESVLGKPTTVQTPGTVGEPLSAGLAAAPVTGGPVGAAGGVEGAGGVGGEIGPSVLQLVQQSLGIAGKGSDLLSRLGSGVPSETGAEKPDLPAQSFSDQLSALFSGGSTASNIAPGSFSSIPASSVLTGAEKPALAAGALEPAAANAAGAGTGASSISSGLGTAAGGAGLAAAVLGLIASLTGNADVGKAAQALGSGAGIAGLGSTLGSAFAGTGAFAPAVAAAPTVAGAAGAAGGLSATAGGVAAPIAAAWGPLLIGSSISGLLGGDDPFGEGIADSLGHRSITGDYNRFVPDLMANQGQQGQAFQVLQQALPYVQSKEELGQLLNSFHNYVGTTQSAPFTGGTGEGVYNLRTIPGVGPRTHGQSTPPVDWGPMTQETQNVITQLLGVLPGQEITARYGEPGGGLEGEPARRLWQQFMIGPGPTGELPTSIYAGEGQPYMARSPEDLANAAAAGTLYNTAGGASATPIWDPATGQWVYASAGGARPQAPGDYFQRSPYWAQLLQGAGGGAAPAGTPAAGPGAIGEQIDELMRAAARGH